jgi:hypothetical protein
MHYNFYILAPGKLIWHKRKEVYAIGLVAYCCRRIPNLRRTGLRRLATLQESFTFYQGRGCGDF